MSLWYQYIYSHDIFSGNATVMKQVAETADTLGRNNVSFLSYFMLGNLEKCLDILIATNRIPEAAFFAR